jgi:orotidine-5'-phosphate decarboxylase
MTNAMDKLIAKIKQTNNPTVMGLDPRYDMIPKTIKSKYSNDVKGACDAIVEFNKGLIDSVYDIIPAVKPQIAFYEMFGIDGIKAFDKTIKYAKEKGMMVIVDAKRGDIGSTAEGYSNAFIGRTPIENEKFSIYDADFITVNPYLGIDGVKPFIDDCKEYGKGIFILVKTSNKSSGELQDLKLEDGKTIYEKVAELVNSWGKDLVGEYGYSSVGAVVGATYPIQIKELREIMPETYFLIPGYGAQGGKAEDIALGFKNGIGGIVNASRSLMTAYKSDRWKDKYTEEQFKEATRAEAIRMRDELNSEVLK